MRTTLTLDDDLLQAAKAIAEARAVSVGQVISDLARKGLHAGSRVGRWRGFPVFRVPQGARRITLEDVKRAQDEP